MGRNEACAWQVPPWIRWAPQTLVSHGATLASPSREDSLELMQQQTRPSEWEVGRITHWRKDWISYLESVSGHLLFPRFVFKIHLLFLRPLNTAYLRISIEYLSL